MAIGTATPEKNIAIMRRFIIEVQEKGDSSLVEELIHPEFCNHTPEGPSPEGRAAPRAMIKSLHSGLSEIKIEVVHCVSTGDIVATQKVIHGIHTGDFFGKAATGQRVQMRVMDFVRINDEMIAEHWATLGPLETFAEN